MQSFATEWLSSELYDQHLENVREQLKVRRRTALESLNKHLSSYATWDVPT